MEKCINETNATVYANVDEDGINPKNQKTDLLSYIRGEIDPYYERCLLNRNNTDDEIKFCNNISNLRIKIKEKFRIISSFKRDYKNIFVVYHYADLDGHGVKLINAMLNENHDSSNTFGCNIRADEAYDEIKKALDGGKHVIIADLNFTKEYAEKVDIELDTSRITLLDHHKSAMYLNKYDWALVVPHDEENKYLSSGSFMFMIYCFIRFNFSTRYDWDNLMSKIITAIALYDTWFWNSDYNDTREMIQENFKDYPEDLNMLFKSLKRDDFVDHIINNSITTSSIMTKEDELKIKFMREQTRKTIFRYYHNMRIVTINDMKIGVVFGDDEVSAVGNYILRANRELSYFVMIDLNLNTVCLRSRKDYDVSTIALDNKGGGHFSAAGFPINKCEGDQFLYDLLNMYNFKLPNIPDKFSIDMIKDVAEFDSENKVYKLK